MITHSHIPSLEYNLFESMQFINISHYRENNITQYYHYDQMLQIFETYKLQHNKNLLQNESMEIHCHRKFLVSNTYDCIDSIGNKFGSILNDFITG